MDFKNWLKLIMNNSKLKFIAIIFMLSLNLPFVGSLSYDKVTDSNTRKDISFNYDINNDQTQKLNQKSDIILQTFYWAVPSGNWYNTIASRLSEISNLGFTYIWLPPPSKTYGPGPNSNGLQVGYEPYDYYDIGEFDQQGGISTRYGNKSDLLNLINLTNNLNISVMADIVLNHNRGGNPLPDGLDFTQVKSGLFLRNASDFNCGDGPSFEDFPDLCTIKPEVRNEILKWGNWLFNEIGYRGWRFDYTIGYNSSTVKAWVDKIGGFSMVEYWQNDVNAIMKYLLNVPSETKALDFPLMYTFINIFSRNGNFNFENIIHQSTSILMTDSQRAITFVDNHDTVRTPYNNIRVHRDFMYAFILLYEGGTPSVFWKDLYPDDECIDPTGTCASQNDLHAQDLKMNLRKLLEIRKNYAEGPGNVIYSDNDLFIYQRDSNPGIILAMNDNPNTPHRVNIKTKYSNTILYDLMGKGKALKVDNQGNMTIEVPPLSYLVYTQIKNPSGDVITTLLTTSRKNIGTNFVDTLMLIGFTFNLMILVKQIKKKNSK